MLGASLALALALGLERLFLVGFPLSGALGGSGPRRCLMRIWPSVGFLAVCFVRAMAIRSDILSRTRVLRCESRPNRFRGARGAGVNSELRPTLAE